MLAATDVVHPRRSVNVPIVLTWAIYAVGEFLKLVESSS